MFLKKLSKVDQKEVLCNKMDEKIKKEKELSIIYNEKLTRCSFYRANPYLDSQDVGRDCKFYEERLNESKKKIDELYKLKLYMYNI